MTHRKELQLAALLIAALPFTASATDAPPEEALVADPGLSAMALFELDQELRTETRVASQRAKSIRETPGVVTVVNREEIIRSGARDLIDVLRGVPGFSFGVDVQGAVGVGFRGNWGHEGKVLLLIDGQEMNENLYSTLQFGNHYPVQDIARVEIIRGPGSAIYGGYAELAVVNVITQSGKELSGARATAFYGHYPTTFARPNLQLQVGHELEAVKGLSFTASALVGQGQRSDGIYQDFYGNEYPMAQNSRIDPRFLNLGMRWHDLSLRFIYDDYRTTAGDMFDEALAEPAALQFQHLIADARYDFKPTERITLTPRLTYKRGKPWRHPDPESPAHYDKVTDRVTGKLMVAWDATDTLNLVAGVEAYQDRAEVQGEETDLNAYFDGEQAVQYQNRAIFAEAFYEHALANVVAGMRFENHSAVGASFVPRLALTKLVNRFHAKALYSRAFRAPGIENIALAEEEIRPERTSVFEAEAGYQVTDLVFVRANAFDIGIQDPIVYFYDEETQAEGYRNFTRTGTRGIEAEVRYRRKNAWATASYSLYRANRNEVDLYEVPERPDLMLGMPMHKVTVAAGLNLWRELHIHPTAIWFSERHGYLRGTDGEAEVEAAQGALLLNLFVSYRNLGVRGLDVGAGVYDLLNQAPPFVQPYAGGHAPLPSSRREVVARLSYTYAFD